MKLSHKTILFIMPFIIIPMMIAASIAFFKINQITEEQLNTQIVTLFDQISQSLKNKTDTTKANLLLLSDHYLVKQYIVSTNDSIRYNILLPQLLNVFKNAGNSIDEYHEICLILSDGNEDARWGKQAAKNNNECAINDAYWSELQTSEEEIFTRLIFDKDKQQYFLLFIKKLMLNNPAIDAYNDHPTLRGYLVITTVLDQLKQDINYNKIGSSGYLSLINQQGKIIFLPQIVKQKISLDVFKSNIQKILLSVKNNLPFSMNINNMQTYVFSKKLNNNMNLIALLPEKELSDNGKQLGLLISLITMVAIAVTIFFVFIALQQLILKPIAILNSAVDSLGRGQLDIKIDINRDDEIGHLTQSFLSMGSKLRLSHMKISHAATHDGLTGLANREKFNSHLEKLLQRNNLKHKFALLFIDLDNFKQINDSMGHQAGDILLQEIAIRFTSILRKDETDDIVSRFGGDEFIIVLNNIDGPWDPTSVAKRIFETLNKPICILNKEVYASCSIGITCYPEDADNVEQLIKKGDLAMYHAKSQGKNQFQFFSENLNKKIHDALQMNTRLRIALDKNHFLLYFQPQFDLQSNQLVGLEALIRLNDPEEGIILPNNFISIAEESGLITPITEWVVHQVCRQNMAWSQAGLQPVPVAVNISSIQFKQHNLGSMIKSCMYKSGLSHSYLKIEITETSLLTNTDEIIEILTELKKLHITVALDDFGTGYSSLSYLDRLPINILKIDISFIRKIKDVNKEYAIVDAIIVLAHALKLKVIAEGVETQQQLEYLRNHHCDMIQGNLLCEAIPADKIAQLLGQAPRDLVN